MSLGNYMVAAMIALGVLAGCKGGYEEGQEPKVVQGKETILRIGDTVKAFSDITGDGQTDIYCEGSGQNQHPFNRNTLSWDKGAKCFVSSEYKQSLDAPVEYEGRFHQTSRLLPGEMETMPADMESRINAAYAALNLF